MDKMENVTMTSSRLLVDRKEIGQGAYGTVYKATHTQWNKVAYKILSSGQEYIEPSCIEALKKEVLAHCKLCHPNIVQMMAMVYEPRAECGIVLWYEKYGNIGKFIRRFRVPLAWKVKQIYNVAVGLNFLHTQQPPIIHGDLKMLNVLVGEGFKAKIGDFGLAVWKDYSSLKTRKAAGALRGTVTHIAPERFADINLRLTESADIYSFGILLWEILTGQAPFQVVNEMLIGMAVINGQRPNVESIPVETPGELSDIMQQSWSQAPVERPSAEDLVTGMKVLKSNWKGKIAEAKRYLQKQESQHGSGSSSDLNDSLERSSGTNVPVEVVSQFSSASAVDHSPAGNDGTNSRCPVPQTPSGEITAVPVEDPTKGRSKYALRDGVYSGLNSDASVGHSKNSVASGVGGKSSGTQQRQVAGRVVAVVAGQQRAQTVPHRLHLQGPDRRRPPTAVEIFTPPLVSDDHIPSAGDSRLSMASSTGSPVQVSSTVSSSVSQNGDLAGRSTNYNISELPFSSLSVSNQTQQ